MAFCSVVMAMVLTAVAVAVVAMVVPARAVAVAIVAARPTGAACTALAARAATSPDALLRGVIRRAKGCADFPEGFVLEITEEDGSAIGGIERLHGLVEHRFDL